MINIYEICAKPPEELSDEDIANCVAVLRQSRLDFNTAQKKGEKVQKTLATPEEVQSLFKDLI